MSMASINPPSQNSTTGQTANRASLTHSGSHQQFRTTPPPEVNRTLSQSMGAIPQQHPPVVYLTNPPVYQQAPQGSYPSIRLSQNDQINPYMIPQAYAQPQQYQGQPAYQYQQPGQQYAFPPQMYQQPQYAQQPFPPQQMPPQQYATQGAPQQYQFAQNAPVPAPSSQFAQPPSPQPNSPQPGPPGTPQSANLYPATPETSPATTPGSKPLPPKHRPPSTPLPPTPPKSNGAPPTNPAFNSSYPELFTFYALGNSFAPPDPRRKSEPPPVEDQPSTEELELIQARMEQQKKSVDEQRMRRQIELGKHLTSVLTNRTFAGRNRKAPQAGGTRKTKV